MTRPMGEVGVEVLTSWRRRVRKMSEYCVGVAVVRGEGGDG